MMISSVNANAHVFQKIEVKVKVCCRFCRPMSNWRLPYVNSPLNLWEKALRLHEVFKEARGRTLWSIKSGRSAVFTKIQRCENKRKGTPVRIPSFFSIVFVWATWRRTAVERSWYLHSIYPILAAGRYLPQSWHLSKLTIINRKSNFMTCVTQNVPWVSHKLPNSKLSFSYCRTKANFDA